MERTVVLKFDPRSIVLIGALLVMIAAALPWANLPSFLAGDLARHGVAGGGWITAGLAVLAALSLLLPWHPLRRVSLLAAGLAILVDLIALAALIRVIQLASTLEMNLSAQLTSVGSGLGLTFAGVVLMLFGGLMNAAPPIASLAAPNARWRASVGWLALGTALVISCMCAWGIGWLVQPYTIIAGPLKTTPTFVPAPTTYLATPLVDVHLAPLGSAPTVPAPSVTPTRYTAAQLATTMAPPPSPSASPTLRTSSPTPPPTPTLPVIGTATPVSTATFTATPTATPNRTTTPTQTRTVTRTPTATPPPSSIETPTPTATNTATTP